MHTTDMRGRRAWHQRAVATAVAAIGLGIGAAGPAAAQAVGVTPPMDALRAAIGDATCDTDAQCATVAVGARACGGPELYLPWSRRSTDAATVSAAADHVTAEQRAASIGGSRASVCRFLADPGAQCVHPASASASASASAPGDRASSTGVCRLRPAGAAGTATPADVR